MKLEIIRRLDFVILMVLMLVPSETTEMTSAASVGVTDMTSAAFGMETTSAESVTERSTEESVEDSVVVMEATSAASIKLTEMTSAAFGMETTSAESVTETSTEESVEESDDDPDLPFPTERPDFDWIASLRAGNIIAAPCPTGTRRDTISQCRSVL